MVAKMNYVSMVSILNFKQLLFFLVLGFTISCSSPGSEYGKALSFVVQSELEGSLVNYESVIVIPGTGCSGCIGKAESYFIQHSRDNKTLFILTGVTSRKNLNNRYGRSGILKRGNVLIDEDGRFHLKAYEGAIYPYRLFIKDGIIIKAERL